MVSYSPQSNLLRFSNMSDLVALTRNKKTLFHWKLGGKEILTTTWQTCEICNEPWPVLGVSMVVFFLTHFFSPSNETGESCFGIVVDHAVLLQNWNELRDFMGSVWHSLEQILQWERQHDWRTNHQKAKYNQEWTRGEWGSASAELKYLTWHHSLYYVLYTFSLKWLLALI